MLKHIKFAVIASTVAILSACSGSSDSGGGSASSGTVTTFAGTVGVAGDADGTGTSASFNQPYGVAVDASGNVYVADQFNHVIRKITSAGVVTTLAGTAGVIGNLDGTGAAASFNHPTGVAVDASGNVYVADKDNSVIRKITSAGVVTTLAGSALGTSGFNDDPVGANALFDTPFGVAVDSTGNVYVSDTGNHVIRKITSAGAVTTLAGSAGTSGSSDDPVGANARFAGPQGIAVDASGNVYVGDYGNKIIRKITSAGAVTTLAGTARVDGAVDATGAAASFSTPNGVAVDSNGNVYVADSLNFTIRKITSAGVVTTLAGTAGVFGNLDGTGAAASFGSVYGVAVDALGTVYAADTSSHTIRKISP